LVNEVHINFERASPYGQNIAEGIHFKSSDIGVKALTLDRSTNHG